MYSNLHLIKKNKKNPRRLDTYLPCRVSSQLQNLESQFDNLPRASKELVTTVRPGGIVLGVAGGEEPSFTVSIIAVSIYVGTRAYISGNTGHCGLKLAYLKKKNRTKRCCCIPFVIN